MLFSIEQNGFAASSYAVNWKGDHQASSEYFEFAYQVDNVVIMSQLIIYYFPQKKMVLLQVLMLYIGMIMILLHLWVSICATIPS
jgi:hypothetical protein